MPIQHDWMRLDKQTTYSNIFRLSTQIIHTCASWSPVGYVHTITDALHTCMSSAGVCLSWVTSRSHADPFTSCLVPVDFVSIITVYNCLLIMWEWQQATKSMKKCCWWTDQSTEWEKDVKRCDGTTFSAWIVNLASAWVCWVMTQAMSKQLMLHTEIRITASLSHTP